jgi:hypothetical protein
VAQGGLEEESRGVGGEEYVELRWSDTLLEYVRGNNEGGHMWNVMSATEAANRVMLPRMAHDEVDPIWVWTERRVAKGWVAR